MNVTFCICFALETDSGNICYAYVCMYCKRCLSLGNASDMVQWSSLPLPPSQANGEITWCWVLCFWDSVQWVEQGIKEIRSQGNLRKPCSKSAVNGTSEADSRVRSLLPASLLTDWLLICSIQSLQSTVYSLRSNDSLLQSGSLKSRILSGWSSYHSLAYGPMALWLYIDCSTTSI